MTEPIPEEQKPRRGRPPTGKAKSNAERQKLWRQQRKGEQKAAHRRERHSSELELVDKLRLRLELEDIIGAQECWLELGQRFSWKRI